MAISETKLNQILTDCFPDAEIKITDLVGDQDHYSLEIKSSQFVGLTIIQQHKLVKKALADVLVSELHAITINTKI
ncbi:MAG: BolA family transcriptional regulator [Rickettsiales bacterium]|nr:MAG: BolA family transcriptional regulator [Rickettsiales bacterium]